MKRYAPYLIAFLLPLGFWGAIGVAGIGLYSVVYWRELLALSRGPLYAALPFAFITVLAAVLGVDPGSSLPPAIGLALMVTVGLQGARLLVANSSTRRLMAAFLLGVGVLALSVGVDYVMGINRIPSGLFHDPSLHNWAGTVMALGFPLALNMAGQPNTGLRVFGVICSSALVVGTVLALSWVGLLGIASGALALRPVRRRVVQWVVIVASLVAAGSLGPWTSDTLARLNEVHVRGNSPHTLEYVISERLAIYREGMRLALIRPVFGWGLSAHSGSLAAIANLVDTRANEVRGKVPATNLLQASEALDAVPWRYYRTQVFRNRAIAPDGSKTADQVIGKPVPGTHIFQLARPANGAADEYTFSIWARTNSGQNDITLALRDATGFTENISYLKSAPGVQILRDRGVRHYLDENWRRLWITAKFRKPPEAGLHVLVYLDGYFRGNSPTDEFYVWGAQLNEGADVLPYLPTGAAALPYVNLNLVAHFHSWFVQTMFDAGILGLLSLVSVVVVFLTRVHGALRAPVRAAVLAFAVTQAVDYAALQASILMSTLMVAGLAVDGGRRSSEGTVPMNIGSRHA